MSPTGLATYTLGRYYMVRGLEPLGPKRGVPLCRFAGLVWEACTTEVQLSVLSTLLVTKGPGAKSTSYCRRREGVCGQRAAREAQLCGALLAVPTDWTSCAALRSVMGVRWFSFL